MINGLGRKGKTSGFYKYDGAKREGLWRRMLFVQILEAAWCMQEKVIGSEAEANLGSIYGWGFPAQTGGVLQYIKDFGYGKFVAHCKEFEEVHGPRFQVPKYILDQVES